MNDNHHQNSHQSQKFSLCVIRKKFMNKELYETTQIRLFLCGKVSKVTKATLRNRKN